MTYVDIQEGDELKDGDTEPDLLLRLYKDNHSPKDVTGATVTFRIKQAEENELTVDSDNVTGDATIVDGPKGLVSYSWQPTDTDSPGSYIGEVRVDIGGDISTFPNKGYFAVRIQDSLG